MQRLIWFRYAVLGVAAAIGTAGGCTEDSSGPSAESVPESRGQKAPADAASSSDEDVVTVEEVAEQTRQALRATGEFVAQNKEEFIAEVEQQLQQIDQKIEQMQARTDEMTEQARAEWQEQYRELRERRRELRQRLDQLEASGETAWQELREGTVEAWNRFETSVRNAADEFAGDTSPDSDAESSGTTE